MCELSAAQRPLRALGGNVAFERVYGMAATACVVQDA
jgi:hypothetical protein